MSTSSWSKGKSSQKQNVTLSPEVEVEGKSSSNFSINAPLGSSKEEAVGDLAWPSAIPYSIDKSDVCEGTASGTFDDDDLNVLEDMRLVLGGHHDHIDHHMDRLIVVPGSGMEGQDIVHDLRKVGALNQQNMSNRISKEVACISSYQECSTDLEGQSVGSSHTERFINRHSWMGIQSIDSSRQEGSHKSTLSNVAHDQSYSKSQDQVCNSNYSSSGGGVPSLSQTLYGTNIVRLILTMSQSGSEQQQYQKQSGQCAGCHAALESLQQPKRSNSYFWNASLSKAGPRFCHYTGRKHLGLELDVE